MTAASWHPARNAFLVPVKALAKLVRGKLRAALAEEPSRSRPARGRLVQALGRPLHRLGMTASRPCSTTSPAMSSASPSPTPASSALDDQSVTIRYKHREVEPMAAPAASPAMSSCAGSCSTSCRKACTRSATSACGIPPSASTRLEPVCCSCSAIPRHRVRPRGVRRPQVRPPAPQRPANPGSALAAEQGC